MQVFSLSNYCFFGSEKQVCSCHGLVGTLKSKAYNSYNTYIAPQATYRSLGGTFVSQTEDVQPLGHRLSLRRQTLTYDQTAIFSPSLLWKSLLYDSVDSVFSTL